MPRANRQTQINVVLPPELFERLHAHLAERGTTLTHVVARAIRRDLDAPPPPALEPPLPPEPPDPVVKPKPAKKPRAKKG
jgi:hypothetical protein